MYNSFGSKTNNKCQRSNQHQNDPGSHSTSLPIASSSNSTTHPPLTSSSYHPTLERSSPYPQRSTQLSPGHLDRRIYVGNLDSTVNEFALVQLFKPIGKMVNLCFKWEKAGPKRGEPKGYCFIEFEKPEAAKRAIKCLNGKRLRERTLIVAPAHKDDEEWFQSREGGSGFRSRRGGSHAYSSPSHRSMPYCPYPSPGIVQKQQKVLDMSSASTDKRILALERKLQQMKKSDG